MTDWAISRGHHRLYDEISARAEANPEAALFHLPDGERLNYGDALSRVGQYAAVLVDQGVSKGDRVAVQVEKSVEAVLVYLACLRTGAIFLPMNTGYTPSETRYLLEDAEPTLFVCDPDIAKTLTDETQSVLTLSADGKGSLTDAVDIAGAAPPVAKCSGDEVGAILYTSGTTGRPKGAMLSYDNLASNAEVLAAAWGFSPRDKLIHVLPIFHAHGLFVAINTVLFSGASLIWLPQFKPERVIPLLSQGTVIMGVPTIYGRLLQTDGFADAIRQGALRLVISGSAPLSARDWERFRDATGHEILERYGMTEILMHTSNPLIGKRVPGSVGPTLPGCEIRVIADDGETRGPNEIGGLQVRGPNVFKGYWRNPEKTAEEFTGDGWFQTGDVGLIDTEGYVHIMGRSKDLVITGGYNVYPKEVEAELGILNGVSESAVFGVSHPDFGEGVCAAIVTGAGSDLTQDGILSLLRPKLAPYKLPKAVFFVDDLPRNAMGKVQKNVLRETYAQVFQSDR
ncbi:MAG: AMP-binding protein [Pseudomonadota bacterium]|nr:AMP-binding protein [Pseudomonadota bacterium]